MDLANQIRDDILDVTSDTATLGKHSGADSKLNKPTYVSLLGLEGAQQRAHELYKNALEAIGAFDDNARWFRALAAYTVERQLLPPGFETIAATYRSFRCIVE